MSSQRRESFRLSRAARWFLPAALLALAPKCLLCIAAYAGLGAALGFGGREICGARANSPASLTLSLVWIGLAGGFGAFGFFVRCRHPKSADKKNNPRITVDELAADRANPREWA